MTRKELEDYLKKQNRFISMDVMRETERYRQDAIAAENEKDANDFWCLAVISYVQNSYLQMYHNLESRNYAQAYRALKEADLQLMLLSKNHDFEKDETDPYHLSFIQSMLNEYEKLFPYEYFICREQVIKEQKCSICGKIVGLRKDCGHIPGKIYMGELCMYETTDYEQLQMKVTTDPFDKYEILEPYQSEQLKYNFGLLDGVMKSLKGPYEYWEVEIVKEKNPEFAKIGRNDKCPCGSGRKFKQCCMNDETKMYFDHYKIKLLNDMDEKVAQPLKILG